MTWLKNLWWNGRGYSLKVKMSEVLPDTHKEFNGKLTVSNGIIGIEYDNAVSAFVETVISARQAIHFKNIFVILLIGVVISEDMMHGHRTAAENISQ